MILACNGGGSAELLLIALIGVASPLAGLASSGLAALLRKQLVSIYLLSGGTALSATLGLVLAILAGPEAKSSFVLLLSLSLVASVVAVHRQHRARDQFGINFLIGFTAILLFAISIAPFFS